MKHLFVPYELAVKLKEKGFDEPCLTYYYPDKELSDVFRGGVLNSKCADVHAAAPLYQQVIDWFREKHDIFILVSLYYNPFKLDLKLYEWSLSHRDNDYDGVFDIVMARVGVEWQHELEKYHLYKSYYEALNKAIEEALKLIK